MNKITNWVKTNTAGALALMLVLGMFAVSFTTNHATTSSKALSLSDLLIQSADAASVDYFLKIDGINGESTTVGHENQLDVMTFSWGESQSGSGGFGGGSGAGKVNMQDFCFTANLSSASPKLFLSGADGRHIHDATLYVVRKAGKDKAQEFLNWKLSDVLVSSYQQSGGPESLIPRDSFCFNFSKIEVEYFPQKADGSLDSSIKAGWDLKENKGV
jgi:type VI secretion system secreted protein Hcp